MALKRVGIVAVATLFAMGGSVSRADSIGDVENARAKDRAGYYLDGGDREKLRRYGRNDDEGYFAPDYADYSDGYDDGADDDDEAGYVGDADDDGPYDEED
jgi:hypothetical protein